MKPSDSELKDMQLAQKDLIIANNKVQFAQSQFQTAQAAFGEVCEKIKEAHKWDATAQCDPNSLKITKPLPPPPPEKQPEKVPAKK